MTDPDYALDIPINVRYHENEVNQIVQSVVAGTYCAVLGPRLCGKTVLLRFVEKTLAESMGWTCLYLDLAEVRASTLQGYFAGLARQVAERLRETTGVDLPPPGPELASSAVFRGYLLDCLQALNRDLVLILDNLDANPTDLVQALLTSLRAAYMDQQLMDHRLTVVVSGALSLATLTVGESSPFRGIATRVFVGDLPEEPSRALIAEYLAAEGVTFTPQARENLLRAASGDPYLIRKLTQRCVERVAGAPGRRLGSRTVHQVIRAVLRGEVYQYAPLVEALRLVGESPDLLRSVLMLLEREPVPKAELPLPLSPDLDPLYLTGVVERVDGASYRLQNGIYRRFFLEHFQAGRVGR
ncbi:MAG: AAA-like domain-containing protein, partial [Anaerolineales bacterium]|nr:AAA-like domain-containing protein [Anaerolineales bacterium]